MIGVVIKIRGRRFESGFESGSKELRATQKGCRIARGELPPRKWCSSLKNVSDTQKVVQACHPERGACIMRGKEKRERERKAMKKNSAQHGNVNGGRNEPGKDLSPEKTRLNTEYVSAQHGHDDEGRKDTGKEASPEEFRLDTEDIAKELGRWAQGPHEAEPPAYKQRG